MTIDFLSLSTLSSLYAGITDIIKSFERQIITLKTWQLRSIIVPVYFVFYDFTLLGTASTENTMTWMQPRNNRNFVFIGSLAVWV